jgi:hypothetical protein
MKLKVERRTIKNKRLDINKKMYFERTVLFFSLKTFKKENSDVICEKRQNDIESIPNDQYQVRLFIFISPVQF